jgi:hypothetical protein
MRRIAIVAAAALAACTPMHWVKPDAVLEQASRDESDCQQRAWYEASSSAWFYRPLAPYFVRGPGGGGAMVWPSGAYVDPFAYQFLEESRLAQFCMESKGYKLVPAPKK